MLDLILDSMQLFGLFVVVCLVAFALFSFMFGDTK